MTGASAPSQGERGWLWVSVGVLVVGGLLHLAFPLSGDQALFLLYAQGLEGGARLYVDLWDNKQPGVFWFYWAAGKVFGFTPVGVHAFESIWLTVAAFVLWRASRQSFQTKAAAAVVPILTVGLYYWVSTPGSMTQIEILVALPLAVCVFAQLAWNGSSSRGRLWPWLFGVSVGVVAVFKLVLISVPLAMWAAGLVIGRDPPDQRECLARRLAWLLAGLAIPVLATAVHFRIQGGWDAFLWTQFVYPSLALAEVPSKPLSEFVRGASWLVVTFLPAVPLGAFVLIDRNPRRLRPLELQAITWLTVGLAIIAIQKFSWWPYHFMLLLPPAGILVASLLDRIAAAHPGRTARGLLVVSVVSIGLAGSLRLDSLRRAIVAAAWAPDDHAILAFRSALDPGYARRVKEAAALRSTRDAPPIYVFGDPNWLLESGRRQALPIHGWAWEFMLREQWEALPRALSAARPQYIHLSPYYADLLAKRSPETIRVIELAYVAAARSFDGGVWYRLAQP